jgi:SAM-dependent methyltransferase
MAQSLGGLYSILRLPRVYDFFQKAVARGDPRRLLTERYIRPRAGDRVVDIGCGPGVMLEYLGDVEYTGIDLEERYIANARSRYGTRAEFVHGRAEDAAKRIAGQADIVLGKSLLHHLDDEQADAFLRAAATILKPDGRLITLDCVYLSPQNPIARFLISLDRGKSVRTRAGYVALASRSFGNVESYLHHGLNRIAYDHCVMVCTKPNAAL